MKNLPGLSFFKFENPSFLVPSTTENGAPPFANQTLAAQITKNPVNNADTSVEIFGAPRLESILDVISKFRSSAVFISAGKFGLELHATLAEKNSRKILKKNFFKFTEIRFAKIYRQNEKQESKIRKKFAKNREPDANRAIPQNRSKPKSELTSAGARTHDVQFTLIAFWMGTDMWSGRCFQAWLAPFLKFLIRQRPSHRPHQNSDSEFAEMTISQFLLVINWSPVRQQTSRNQWRALKMLSTYVIGLPYAQDIGLIISVQKNKKNIRVIIPIRILILILRTWRFRSSCTSVIGHQYVSRLAGTDDERWKCYLLM